MRRRTVLLALAVALTSCTSTDDGRSPPSSQRALKIAFLEDLSLQDATSMVVPAFQGAKLAIDEATGSGLGIALVAEDTGGDPAKAVQIARELVPDPSVIAVIVGPFSTGLGQAASILVDGGMPVLSLSTISPFNGSAPPAPWLDAVASEVDEANALAGYLEAASSGGPICLGDEEATDGTLASLVAARVESLARVKIAETNSGSDFRSAVAGIAHSGCSALFWNASGPEAARLRKAMDAAGLDAVWLLGADQMKDPEFLSEAGAAGDGTVVVCACVDITTSTGLAARKFIQDFQADFGLPPGPYSAEAWDVAQMLLGAMEGGARTRSDLLAHPLESRPYLGLAGWYALEPSGSLVRASSGVTLFRDVGGRWIQISG